MSRLLVIDDDPSVTRLLEEHLSSEGHEVTSVHLAEEGFQKAIQAPPELIFLDVMLPDATGFQMLGRFRQNPVTRNIPIIMMTGTARFPNQQQIGKSMGANEYLLKPFNILDLGNRVRHMLELQREKQYLGEPPPDGSLENLPSDSPQETVPFQAIPDINPAPIVIDHFAPKESAGKLSMSEAMMLNALEAHDKIIPESQPVMRELLHLDFIPVPEKNFAPLVEMSAPMVQTESAEAQPESLPEAEPETAEAETSPEPVSPIALDFIEQPLEPPAQPAPQEPSPSFAFNAKKMPVDDFHPQPAPIKISAPSIESLPKSINSLPLEFKESPTIQIPKKPAPLPMPDILSVPRLEKKVSTPTYAWAVALFTVHLLLAGQPFDYTHLQAMTTVAAGWAMLLGLLTAACTFFRIQLDGREALRILGWASIPIILRTAANIGGLVPSPMMMPDTVFWLRPLDVFEMASGIILAVSFRRLTGSSFLKSLFAVLMVGLGWALCSRGYFRPF